MMQNYNDSSYQTTSNMSSYKKKRGKKTGLKKSK